MIHPGGPRPKVDFFWFYVLYQHNFYSSDFRDQTDSYSSHMGPPRSARTQTVWPDRRYRASQPGASAAARVAPHVSPSRPLQAWVSLCKTDTVRPRVRRVRKEITESLRCSYLQRMSRHNCEACTMRRKYACVLLSTFTELALRDADQTSQRGLLQSPRDCFSQTP